MRKTCAKKIPWPSFTAGENDDSEKFYYANNESEPLSYCWERIFMNAAS